MSLNNFIPTLWSDMILAQLRKQLIAELICNRDYEGEISAMGDTVKINAIGDVTVSNYTKDTAISNPQTLTDAQTMLTLDQAKYFNFGVDDVDRAQQNPKVFAEAASWAAYRMADQVDQFILGHYTDAGSSIGTSGSPTSVVAPIYSVVGGGTAPLDYMMNMGQLLTQTLCPRSGRWLIAPPWWTYYMLLDQRTTSFNTPAAQARIAAGPTAAINGSGPTSGSEAFIGHIAGFDCYESINAHQIGGTEGAAGSQDVVLAGHPMGITYAAGLTEVEAYRHPNYFQDNLKGLEVYGARVTRPACLCAGYFQHP